MSQDRINILQRALHRERESRKAAEKILEEKSTELYHANKKLEKLYEEVETELTKTDSQLQGVFESIVDAYIIIDLKGEILKMNDAALNLFGFDHDKIDFNILELVNPSNHAKFHRSFNKLLKKGILTDLELNITTKRGKEKTVHINASVINEKNVPVAVQGIVRDITILKENELVIDVIRDITQSILGKMDLHEIAKVITEKIAHFLDSEDCIIYLYHEEDDMLEQISGYGEKLNESNELINKLFIKRGQGIVGHVAKSGKAEIVKNTKLDKRYIVDIIERKSEITVPILVENKVIGIIDSEHELENFYTKKHLAVLTNIAEIISVKLKSAIDFRERINAEEQLINSESRLASLILNLDAGVLLEDENRKIVLTNKQFCNFFQIPALPEQLIGMDCTNAADQSKHLFLDPESFVTNINKITEKREMVLGDELTMVNGQIFERDYIPIFSNQDYKGHLWSYKDVTLKRKFRNSLDAQRKKYRDIIANMNLGLLEVDKDDVILMANQSFSNISGYTEEELLGKNAGNIFTSNKGNKKIEEENKKRENGISGSYELEVKNKAGEIRYWLISGAPNYNINGKVVGSIGIHLDITDFKLLQLQKEKLLNELEKSNDELQEYAHVVSHDLKSPLRNINALVSWLKEDNKGNFNEISLKNFQLIESTLEKMEQLISNILIYSSLGSESIKKELVDLNEVFSGLKEILFVPDHMSISVKKELPIVNGDNLKLQQLFQNLFSNAIKFCDKENGIIEVDCVELETHYQFSVKDNGMGIEEKYHNQIFKIFNYLNKSNDSSGIGLSIVKKIVTMHKGQIWLESQLGKGSTFYFTIKK